MIRIRPLHCWRTAQRTLSPWAREPWPTGTGRTLSATTWNSGSSTPPSSLLWRMLRTGSWRTGRPGEPRLSGGFDGVEPLQERLASDGGSRRRDQGAVAHGLAHGAGKGQRNDSFLLLRLGEVGR